MIEELKPCPEMIDSGLRCNLDGAIGGSYHLPDGREFWFDAVAAREVLARIEPVIASWVAAHTPAYDPDKRLREALEEVLAITQVAGIDAASLRLNIRSIVLAALSHNGG